MTPGEEITLQFIIFDEHDAVYDSAVLIDNFTWELTQITAPVTINSPALLRPGVSFASR